MKTKKAELINQPPATAVQMKQFTSKCEQREAEKATENEHEKEKKRQIYSTANTWSSSCHRAAVELCTTHCFPGFAGERTTAGKKKNI